MFNRGSLMMLVRRHVRLPAAVALLALVGSCGAAGEPRAPPTQSAMRGKLVEAPAATLDAGALTSSPRSALSNAIRVRLTMQPDPGSTGVVVPQAVELPNGEIVVAGTSWSTNLGEGAERVADGFVAGYGANAERRWMCLCDSPPGDLRADGSGRVYVPLGRPGASACAPAAAQPRAAGRSGAPDTHGIISSTYVALDAGGAPRWSEPLAALGVPVVMRAAVGDRGSSVLFGYENKETFAFSLFDDGGRVVRSRRGKSASLETLGPNDFPEFAVSPEGDVVMYTGVFPNIVAGAPGQTPPPERSLAKLDSRGRTTWFDPMSPATGRGRDEQLYVSALAFDHDDVLVLGHASRSMKLGGRLVESTSGEWLFFARLDSAGRARWARTFEKGPGLDPEQGAQLLRAKDGAIVITRSSVPATNDRGPDVVILLVRFDRAGREVFRRTLPLSDMDQPLFAASASGDAVLASATVTSAQQQHSLFPGSPFVAESVGRTILIGHIPMH